MNAIYCNRLQCQYKGHNRKSKAVCKFTQDHPRIKHLEACPLVLTITKQQHDTEE